MSFRDIVGHRRLKRLLARAVHSGTLPPSLVFAGPDGIGKKHMAFALAQALNCLAPVETARVSATRAERARLAAASREVSIRTS